MSMEITETDQDRLEKLFVGRRIVGAEGDTLTLDNGTTVRCEGNVGGCQCGAGDYDLTKIAAFDNVITSVQVDTTEVKGDYGYPVTVYRLFTYAAGVGESVAEFTGDDGNGYYGTGFALHVSEVSA